MTVETSKEEGQTGVMRFIIGRHPKRTLIRIGVLVVVTWVLFKFVLLPIRVAEVSMLPTYKDGQLTVLNRLAYVTGKPQRGDIVGIKLAGPHLMYLKRIIALPGERIKISGGVVHINGQPLEEDYLKLSNPSWHEAERTLGPTEYYFLGDNRSMPIEAHDHGTADGAKIAGKVLF